MRLHDLFVFFELMIFEGQRKEVLSWQTLMTSSLVQKLQIHQVHQARTQNSTFTCLFLIVFGVAFFPCVVDLPTSRFEAVGVVLLPKRKTSSVPQGLDVPAR